MSVLPEDRFQIVQGDTIAVGTYKIIETVIIGKEPLPYWRIEFTPDQGSPFVRLVQAPYQTDEIKPARRARPKKAPRRAGDG